MRTTKDSRRLGIAHECLERGVHSDRCEACKAEADLSDAIGLLREEDSIAAEEKRLVKEYPAGTCNAEDAWSDFMKREREFKKRRAAFLREPQGEVEREA